MNRPAAHVVAGMLSLALAGRATSAELAPSAASPAPSVAPGSNAALAPLLPAHQLSPVVAEMYAFIDGQRDKIARLRAELAQARDGSRALELQRALSATKRETELQLLRIQASHARREGRLEAAGSLEAAITAMTTPPASREPAARPAPSRDSDR